MHYSGLDSDLKHLLKHIFRGASLLKTKQTNKWKLWKTIKNTQSNLIARVKMLNIGCHQQIYYKLRNGREGYLVLVNYQFLSNFFSLALPQLFFSINCLRNRLLRVKFIELLDFVIYQHLNKRTKILSLATFQIAHLWNQFNHVCIASFKATF